MDATFGWTASSEGIGIGVDFSMKSGLAEISLQLFLDLFCFDFGGVVAVLGLRDLTTHSKTVRFMPSRPGKIKFH